jgi:hypothetical protein
MVTILTKVGCAGWSFIGVSLWSSLRIPNISPSQARFDLVELKRRFAQTGSPKNVTLTHWDWTFAVFCVMLKLRRACVSLTLSHGKVSPSPLNVGLLELLVNFNCELKLRRARVSLSHFPQRSVALTFECRVARTLSRFYWFCA